MNPVDVIASNPIVAAIILAGAVSSALYAVWRIWIRPAFRALRDAVNAAMEISRTLRKMSEFFETELPALLGRLDAGAERFESHEQRIARIEERQRRVERIPR